MKELLVNLVPILPILLTVLFLSKKQKPWSELTEKERNTKIMLVIFAVFLFIAGIVVAFLY